MGDENKVTEAPEIKTEKPEKPKKAKGRGATPAETVAEAETEETEEEAATAQTSMQDQVVTEGLRQMDTAASTRASAPGTGGADAKPIKRHPLAFELRVSRRSR